MERVEKFLKCDEINHELISHNPHKSEAISVKKTNFTWGGMAESADERKEREKQEKEIKEGKIKKEDVKEKETDKIISDIITL